MKSRYQRAFLSNRISLPIKLFISLSNKKKSIDEGKDPQPIQKVYSIIEFSEVSHSKGENILLAIDATDISYPVPHAFSV